MPDDCITIAGLDLPARIGVPDAERAGWQSLKAELTLYPVSEFSGMPDSLEATVDYETVAKEVRTLAASRPRKLLETLAADIAGHILAHFAVSSVAVELRKRVLPGVDYVSVRLRKDRSA